MILSVASGKGGTGKTTIAVALSTAIEKDVHYLDCDVEEPNSHLFLKPKWDKKLEIPVSIPVPLIDESRCTFCGKCSEICEFNAIMVVKGTAVIPFHELCHGCGGCSLVCPEKAISEKDKIIGIIRQAKIENIHLSQGLLNIGEPMGTPIVKRLKKTINPNHYLTILDAPPGTGCSVVESIRDSDFSLLVTEPTPFGLYDLKLAVDVVRKLSVPFGVLINRADVGDAGVREYCKKENINILMEIPLDEKIAYATSQGIPLSKVEGYKDKMVKLYEKIATIIGGK
ncbi:MAG: (4Fe-4S)-binding protein [Spirochaetes bacterium]|nr:MAG: (4Fe-4S)-binding protein [Spirochaetota bacterium]